MGKMGSFKISGMKELQRELSDLEKNESAFVEACAKELAARLLAKVIKRTPVGDYSQEVTVTAKRDGKKHKKGDQYTKRINKSGKRGGTLRRGWTSKTQEEAEGNKTKPQAAEILEYANGLQISRSGGFITVEIINPVEYALI